MTYPEKHIALICNPKRHNHKAVHITDDISVLLSGMDIRHSVFTAYWPEVWSGFTEAWIICGDGTVNWFLNQYPDFDLPLAVFGGGTANDLHWMIYGEMTIEKQVDRLLEAQPKPIDAGICNGKLFINGVGIGFGGAVVKELSGRAKMAGKVSYLLTILKHIVGYHEKLCIIEMEDEVISQQCFMINVANGKRHGGSFIVAPKASLTDELLDVSILGAIPPLKRIKCLPVVEKGEHLQLPFVEYRQVKKIKITSPVKLHAHIDGEYLHENLFEIEILPKRFSFLY